MRLGLLQCGHIAQDLVATYGDYDRLYADLLGDGFDWTTYDVTRGEVPDGPEAADGWLVSGSKAGAYEGHAWIAPLEDLIRRIAGTQRPLVGICFGHQIVAQALGGIVVKHPGGWMVGRRDYDWEGTTVALTAWHQDQVTVPPEGARTIMTNRFTRHAGLAVGESILTLQPHPEFTGPFVREMTVVRAGTVPPDLMADAAAQSRRRDDSAEAGRRLAKFFQDRRP